MKRSSCGAAAAFAAAALAACTPSQGRPAPRPAPPRQAKPASSSPATQGLNLSGQNSTVTMPDRKHPQWFVCKLTMKEFAGAITTNSVKGHGVTANLFDKGKPSGVMTAPTATGNFQTETVYATDGVHFVSLAPTGRPTGRILDADSVIWNAKTQLGKAFGNVRFHDAKSGVVVTPPVLYFNSSLEKFGDKPNFASVSPSGGG